MTLKEKEEQLLGFLILTPSYIAEALSFLQAEDFTFELHQKIFSNLKELFTSNKEIDELIISDKLGNQKIVTDILQKNIMTSSSFLEFVKDLREDASLRKTIIVANKLVAAVKGKDLTKIEGLKQELLQEGRQKQLTPKGISDLTEDYLEYYKQKEASGILSSIPKLDYYTSGFQPGDFITISARTGIGKTNLCLNFALSAVKQHKKVLFISLEMLPNQLLDRLIAMQSGMNAHILRRREIEIEKVSESLTALTAYPLKILFSSELTSLEVFTLGYTEKILNGVDVIFLDYLGRLIDKTSYSEEERLTRICRNLKNCALKLQIPVISPVQIDKISAKSASTPVVEDAKGSTSIGHESDLSLALLRVDRTMPDSKLIITKNRHGSCADINMFFNLKTLIFTEIEGQRQREELDKESSKVDPSIVF